MCWNMGERAVFSATFSAVMGEPVQHGLEVLGTDVSVLVFVQEIEDTAEVGGLFLDGVLLEG